MDSRQVTDEQEPLPLDWIVEDLRFLFDPSQHIPLAWNEGGPLDPDSSNYTTQLSMPSMSYQGQQPPMDAPMNHLEYGVDVTLASDVGFDPPALQIISFDGSIPEAVRADDIPVWPVSNLEGGDYVPNPDPPSFNPLPPGLLAHGSIAPDILNFFHQSVNFPYSSDALESTSQMDVFPPINQGMESGNVPNPSSQSDAYDFSLPLLGDASNILQGCSSGNFPVSISSVLPLLLHDIL